MLSSNTNFTNEEKDVVIIWANDSMKGLCRFRIENMLPAMTRAKKAVLFIGCMDVFRVRIL